MDRTHGRRKWTAKTDYNGERKGFFGEMAGTSRDGGHKEQKQVQAPQKIPNFTASRFKIKK